MARLKGFTLIEVLLTLVIVGILGAAILLIFNPFEQIRKANDTKRKSDLAQLQRALEIYYQDFGSYPQSSTEYKIVVNSVALDWGDAWNPYMPKLPIDPVPNNNQYVYYSPPTSSGQSYYIYVTLERGVKDPQVCNAGNACSSMSQSGFPSAQACGGTCNYGVSSPNVSP